MPIDFSISDQIQNASYETLLNYSHYEDEKDLDIFREKVINFSNDFLSKVSIDESFKAHHLFSAFNAHSLSNLSQSTSFAYPDPKDIEVSPISENSIQRANDFLLLQKIDYLNLREYACDKMGQSEFGCSLKIAENSEGFVFGVYDDKKNDSPLLFNLPFGDVRAEMKKYFSVENPIVLSEKGNEVPVNKNDVVYSFDVEIGKKKEENNPRLHHKSSIAICTEEGGCSTFMKTDDNAKELGSDAKGVRRERILPMLLEIADKVGADVSLLDKAGVKLINHSDFLEENILKAIRKKAVISPLVLNINSNPVDKMETILFSKIRIEDSKEKLHHNDFNIGFVYIEKDALNDNSLSGSELIKEEIGQYNNFLNGYAYDVSVSVDNGGVKKDFFVENIFSSDSFFDLTISDINKTAGKDLIPSSIYNQMPSGDNTSIYSKDAKKIYSLDVQEKATISFDVSRVPKEDKYNPRENHLSSLAIHTGEVSSSSHLSNDNNMKHVGLESNGLRESDEISLLFSIADKVGSDTSFIKDREKSLADESDFTKKYLLDCIGRNALIRPVVMNIKYADENAIPAVSSIFVADKQKELNLDVDDFLIGFSYVEKSKLNEYKIRIENASESVLAGEINEYNKYINGDLYSVKMTYSDNVENPLILAEGILVDKITEDFTIKNLNEKLGKDIIPSEVLSQMEKGEDTSIYSFDFEKSFSVDSTPFDSQKENSNKKSKKSKMKL